MKYSGKALTPVAHPVNNRLAVNRIRDSLTQLRIVERFLLHIECQICSVNAQEGEDFIIRIVVEIVQIRRWQACNIVDFTIFKRFQRRIQIRHDLIDQTFDFRRAAKEIF